MQIAIISDIHDNLVNLDKFLSWAKEKKIEQIICPGDVTKIETLQYLLNHFSKTVHLVRGNMEIYYDEELEGLKNLKYYGYEGVFEIGSYRVGLCHEPFRFENVLALGEPQIIFYGHTHKPYIETKNKIQYVNPGTLAGTFSRASFAHWDTEKNKIDLILLENL